ncbi:MAG: hypothetical protein HOL58_08550 [Francisellaceae bacterium]|jgi:hypothetical protein|nr:hypothetical protein [Francisellaceae bacterium]
MYIFTYPIYWFYNPIYSKITVAIVFAFLFYSFFNIETILPLSFITLIVILLLSVFSCSIKDSSQKDSLFEPDKLRGIGKIIIWQIIISVITFFILNIIIKMQTLYLSTNFQIDISAYADKRIIVYAVIYPWILCVFFAANILFILKVKREPFLVKIIFDTPKRHPALFLHNAFCGMTYLYSSNSLIFIIGIFTIILSELCLENIGLSLFRSPIISTMVVVLVIGANIIVNIVRAKIFMLRRQKFVTQILLMMLINILLIVTLFYISARIGIYEIYAGLKYESKFAEILIHNRSACTIALLLVVSQWFVQGFSSYIVKMIKGVSIAKMYSVTLVFPVSLSIILYYIDLSSLISVTQQQLDNKVILSVTVVSSLLVYLYQYKGVRDTLSFYAYGLTDKITQRKNLLDYYKFLFPLTSAFLGVIILNGWYGILFSWGATYISALFAYWFYIAYGAVNLYAWKKNNFNETGTTRLNTK